MKYFNSAANRLATKKPAIQYFAIYFLLLAGISLINTALTASIIIIAASFVLEFFYARNYSKQLLDSSVTLLDAALFTYMVFGFTCYENHIGIPDNTPWMMIVLIAFDFFQTFTAYIKEGVFRKSTRNADRNIMTAIVTGWTSLGLVLSAIYIIYTRYDLNAYIFAGASMLSALGLLWVLFTSNYRTPSVKRQMQTGKYGFLAILVCFIVEYAELVSFPTWLGLFLISVYVLDVIRAVRERISGTNDKDK